MDHSRATLTISATPSRGLVIRQGDRAEAWTDPKDILRVLQWGVGGYPVGGFYLDERQMAALAYEAGKLLTGRA